MRSRPLKGLILLGLVAVAAGVGGCTYGYAIPAAHVSEAKDAITAAGSAGASQDPQASIHLRLAQDELTNARAMMARGEPERADLLFLRARSDAKLALALAQEASAKAEAQEVIDRIRALSVAQP